MKEFGTLSSFRMRYVPVRHGMHPGYRGRLSADAGKVPDRHPGLAEKSEAHREGDRRAASPCRTASVRFCFIAFAGQQAKQLECKAPFMTERISILAVVKGVVFFYVVGRYRNTAIANLFLFLSTSSQRYPLPHSRRRCPP